MKRRLLSFFLAVTVLGAQALAGSIAFACEMHGEVHRACCCEGEATGAMHPAGGGQADCGCCDMQVVESAPAFFSSGTVVKVSAQPVSAALSPDPVPLDFPEPTSVRAPSEANRLCHRTRSLFVLNASFRI